MIARPLASLVLLLALVAPLGACKKDSDEKKILAMLAAGEEAAQAGKVGTLTDFLTDDFVDADGNDKAAVKAVLAGYVLRGGRIVVVRRNEKVTVNGDTGTVDFDAFLAGGDRSKLGGQVPTDGDAYRFSFVLRRVDGEWKISGGTWQPIPASGFLLKK